MMREANSPNVKLMFDTIHAMYRNEPMQDYVKVMGKDLAHIHVSDHRRLPPGAGGTDFRPLIEALKEVGYLGFLTQEVGFASRGVNPDADAVKGLEYMRSLLQ
jgi:protein FrlC